jgi:hypothetical protein
VAGPFFTGRTDTGHLGAVPVPVLEKLLGDEGVEAPHLLGIDDLRLSVMYPEIYQP